jgi:PAT family beta-lactamase induction signal transducer AmpG
MTDAVAAPPPKPSLVKSLFNRRMLICVFTGFSSGLPLYIVLNLVPAWLRTEGLSLKTIGAFSLIQAPYTWKFLWSPLLDRYAVKAFGRRRTWMVLSQLALLAGIGVLGTFSPTLDIKTIIVVLVFVAFSSATQDIALDAYRREILPDEELGLGNSIHVNAYRIAGLVPGSVSLILADHLPWDAVFFITALFMLPGLLLALVANEPARAIPPRSLRAAVVEPFKEFFGRKTLSWALLILAFLFLYKVGDAMCTALATPFYLDMGYSKSEIGVVAKNAGLWPSVIGGLLGGLWMVKLGMNRALWLFGVVQLTSILGFAALAFRGKQTLIDSADLAALAGVIGYEALGVGLGSAALVAFIAKTVSPQYAATQLALLTSIAVIARTFVSATTGAIIESVGWFPFFLICTACGVPGMLLLFKVAPWNEKPAEPVPAG